MARAGFSHDHHINDLDSVLAEAPEKPKSRLRLGFTAQGLGDNRVANYTTCLRLCDIVDSTVDLKSRELR